MPRSSRLDIVMVERGLAETRTRAQALIMAGQVTIDGRPATKAGMPAGPSSLIEVITPNPYVSRGGQKLAAALDSLDLSPAGKVCLDIGASTGGFTDCLLQRGAVRVYATDVGKNQLHERLRSDPRVVSMEGVNFRYFSMESLKEKIEFVTIDVSFISLEKILPCVPALLADRHAVVAMVKPQFETPPALAPKGVVRDDAVRAAAIAKVGRAALMLGFEVKGGADAGLPGPKGNREYFLWLELRRM